MSGLTYVGQINTPKLVPGIMVSIGDPAVTLSANLTGALSLSASFSASPPSVAFYLSALTEIQTQLALGISLGAPSASFSFSDTVTLVAQLELAFSLLVDLEALLSLNLSLGFYSWTYSGPANLMGAAITTETAIVWPDGVPSSTHCNALVLGAVNPTATTSILGLLNGLSTGNALVYTAKLKTIAALSLVTEAATTQGGAAISAQLKAALAMQANLRLNPPTLAVTAVALAHFAANLRAALAIAPPNVSVAISATADLAASISAQFGLVVELGLTLRYDAELFVYTYDGPGNTLPAGPGLGWALTSALSSKWGDNLTPTALPCTSVILVTLDPGDWANLLLFFAGAV